MLYLEGENNEIIRIRLNKSYNYIDLLECENPFCGCKDCQLIFLTEKEYYDETVEGIPVAVNLSKKEIIDVHYTLTKFQKEKSINIRTLLEENLEEADWLLLQRKHKNQKEKQIEKISLSEIEYEYEFSEEHLLNEGLKISYQAIFPSCELFIIEKDGIQYTVIEQYCKDVKCDCTEISLQIYEEKVCIENFNYDYKKEDLKDIKYQWVINQLKEKYVGFKERVNIRDLKIKNLYARNWIRVQNQYVKYLDEEKSKKSVKIGRNDKCPCGSGKKYKKCCLNN